MTTSLAAWGWMGMITFYQYPNFQGNSFSAHDYVVRMSAVDANFSWQDRISSCVITDDAWIVYKDSEYRGGSAYLPPGRYPDGDAMRIGGDVMSSARRVPHYADPDPWILLFRDANYNGTVRVVGEDLPSMNDWNDSVTSIIVTRGTWLLFADANYKGTQWILGPGQYSNSNAAGIRNDTVSSLRIIGR